MTTYAPQPEPVSRRVDSAPASAPPQHSSQPPPTVPRAATVAYVPPSALISDVLHRPLQPNRHHPFPDTWHHERTKPTLPSRLPPPSSQEHHPKPEKSPVPESQPRHHSHARERSHLQERVPETAHSYHHHLVAPHLAPSRLTPPTHHASYLYPVHHQLVTPVAHVPIGAAHYAHLPPSIWSPPHAQYHHHHQHGHPQPHHQLPPTHHVTPAVMSAPHGQVPYPTSHVHHVAAATHPPTHAYALPPPHTATTPHPPTLPPPPGPQHAVHPGHHPPQHIAYTYAQVQHPPPTHHAVKTAVAVSQPVAIGGPVSYPPAHVSQPAGIAVSASPQCNTDPIPVHRSPGHRSPGHRSPGHRSPGHRSPGQRSPSLPNGIVSSAERIRPYMTNSDRPETERGGSGTEDRTDMSSPRPSMGRRLAAEGSPPYNKTRDQKKESSQKDKGQLAPGQPIRKPRKPYTIKKSREVWTPEEHGRFLQALQLYDRDWKKIESYIGTKTVLQIRSHAQKHFGKVAKYKTGEYIPPPRPKKRAALPYPRSRTVGQSKSHSPKGSAVDKVGTDENGSHSARDPNPKTGGDDNRSPTDGKQGLSSLNGTINGITKGTAVAGAGNDSKQPIVKSPHGASMEAAERRPGSIAYGDKYPSSSYDRQLDNRSQEGDQRRKLPQTNGFTHWRPALQSEEPGREPIATPPIASSSSTDIKTGINSSASDPHVHRRGSSSYSEDLRRREVQYDRGYRHATSHVHVSFKDNAVSRHEDRRSPKRLSSSQAVEHDTSTVKGDSRKKMAMPNNSLLVLSNCVDMMSREVLPERQPAAGWAMAAAARRAHRAKVIRARKPPLPQSSLPVELDDPVHGREGSPRREVLDTDVMGDHTAMKRGSSDCGSQSPAVNSSSEYDQPPPDSERISPGSGTGSDDAIAGFSSSDRPSVSGSADGSGTGGSPDTSDAGDPEEDPKSSNDGSGDDGNRRSPPTRDSSPGDPSSSGSRENSPNDGPMPQQSSDAIGGQVDNLQKATDRNAMPMQRNERDINGKNPRTEAMSGRDHGENGNELYGGRVQDNEKLLTTGNGRQSDALQRTVHSVSRDDMSLPGRSPRDDRGAQIHRHEHASNKVSPNSLKRLRPGMEYDMHNQTDDRAGEDGRDPEPKRQRAMRASKEPSYNADQSYHRRDFAERHR